jgi:hypothetical protein
MKTRYTESRLVNRLMIDVLALPRVTYSYITMVIINVVLKLLHVLTYD